MGDTPAPSLLAARLDKLFSSTGETTAKVAAAITDNGDVSVTRGYLHDLRTGAKDNPSYRLLVAIANHFDVSPDYFTDTETGNRISDQIDQLVELRETGLASVLLRNLDGLSQDGLRAVLDTVRVARYKEGLPTDSLDTDHPGPNHRAK